jgi:hypothetical protein
VDQPVAKPLPANRTAQTEKKRTETYMPQMGFEPTIPVFERAKPVHALDRAANVIGKIYSLHKEIHALNPSNSVTAQ